MVATPPFLSATAEGISTGPRTGRPRVLSNVSLSITSEVDLDVEPQPLSGSSTIESATVRINHRHGEALGVSVGTFINVGMLDYLNEKRTVIHYTPWAIFDVKSVELLDAKGKVAVNGICTPFESANYCSLEIVASRIYKNENGYPQSEGLTGNYTIRETRTDGSVLIHRINFE